jgi:hypothetical protein
MMAPRNCEGGNLSVGATFGKESANFFKTDLIIPHDRDRGDFGAGRDAASGV